MNPWILIPEVGIRSSELGTCLKESQISLDDFILSMTSILHPFELYGSFKKVAKGCNSVAFEDFLDTHSAHGSDMLRCTS